jgi:hypothetical protein
MSFDLRRLVRRLKPREQLLMVLFFSALVLIWLGSAWQRLDVASETLGSLEAEGEINELWLSREASIRFGLEEVKGLINPEMTYSRARLSAEVDRLAREIGVPFTAEAVRTREAQAYVTHIQRINLQGASLAQLITFEETLLRERPYLSLEEVRILPRSSRLQLDATFVVTAIELR